MKQSVHKSNMLSFQTACQTLPQSTIHKCKPLSVVFVVIFEWFTGYIFHFAAHEVKSIPVVLLACNH